MEYDEDIMGICLPTTQGFITKNHVDQMGNYEDWPNQQKGMILAKQAFQYAGILGILKLHGMLP